MGYTHYYFPKFTKSDDSWENFRKIAGKIIELTSARLVWELDEPDKEPEVSEDVVRFNGPGGDGHETFIVVRDADMAWDRPCDWVPGTYFAFTKTARKPYDTAVVACCMAGVATGVMERWSSDGEKPEHEEGLALFKRAIEETGVKIENEDYAAYEEDE